MIRTPDTGATPPPSQIEDEARVLRAAGSLAVRAAVAGPRQAATVLGTPAGAAYLRCADGTLLAVLGTGAPHLPCGLLLGVALPESPAGPASAGGGEVRLGGYAVRVVRWWDPRPVLRTRAVRPAAVSRLRDLLPEPPVDVAPLAAALEHGEPAAVRAAAAGLAGLGPGLTPAGDDVLTGLVGAWAAFGRNDDLAGVVVAAAAGRTTELADALLRHAAAGECAAEVGSLLRSLVGRGDVALAYDRLAAVGHSTGVSWAYGVLLGAT